MCVYFCECVCVVCDLQVCVHEREYVCIFVSVFVLCVTCKSVCMGESVCLFVNVFVLHVTVTLCICGL